MVERFSGVGGVRVAILRDGEKCREQISRNQYGNLYYSWRSVNNGNKSPGELKE